MQTYKICFKLVNFRPTPFFLSFLIFSAVYNQTRFWWIKFQQLEINLSQIEFLPSCLFLDLCPFLFRLSTWIVIFSTWSTSLLLWWCTIKFTFFFAYRLFSLQKFSKSEAIYKCWQNTHENFHPYTFF